MLLAGVVGWGTDSESGAHVAVLFSKNEMHVTEEHENHVTVWIPQPDTCGI